MCASEMIEHRKNSWELYGFDYMIDANYNAWLIEINSSPACDYSTKVTERYVQKALVELLSVVLDCREWESQPKKTRGEQPDTYGWENIYHGPLLDTPVAAFGTDMTLKGEAMKGLPKRAVPLPNRSLGFVKKCENDGDVEELTINGKNNQTLRSFNESSIRSNNSEKLNIVPRSRSTEGSAIEKSTRLAETSNALGGTIFDDSDDDNSPTKSSKRLATLEESTKGRDARGGNKKIEIEKTGLSTKNTTPSVAGSAIPIKVFNVEF